MRQGPSKINADMWVDRYGDALFHFALARVKDRDIAEDLVQETFLAAVQSQDRFKGRSSEKTCWMFRCRDVSEKVSRSMDESVPLRHRLAIRMHLLMCRTCARFRRQLFMLRTMSRYVDDDQPGIEAITTLSQEAKERIKTALRALH